MKIQLSFLGIQIMKRLDVMDRQTVEEMLPKDPTALTHKTRAAYVDAVLGLMKLGVVEECSGEQYELEYHKEHYGLPVYRLKRTTREEWWLLASAIELPYGIMLPIVKVGAEEEVEWTLNV